MRFRDRDDAGRQLADALGPMVAGLDDVVVLGLPRGGVPVARHVADRLGAPLDVLCVRKLGLPGHPEFAMGAIGEGGVRVLDRNLIARVGVTEHAVSEVERRERAELDRRTSSYRGTRPPVDLGGRVAIIVDDGLATGSTARAAIQVARASGARTVILAVPVAPQDTVTALQSVADQVVAVMVPSPFHAVGEWYADFDPTTDAEVTAALAATDPATGDVDLDAAYSAVVQIPIGPVRLEGQIDVPGSARGIVIFAHGSGSSRHSVRNQAVARRLRAAGFATLLFDLLTDAEAHDRSLVFDTVLLADRLRHVSHVVETDPRTRALPIGLFGASTGAGAALRVAAHPDAHIGAVVSRGGRPDLADEELPAVRAPTLLIVGGDDEPTLRLNREAATRLGGPHQLVIIPGATHLFEEPGALESVADLAAEFFGARLGPESGSQSTDPTMARIR